MRSGYAGDERSSALVVSGRRLVFRHSEATLLAEGRIRG
jgi:hypothetical protein